jgi:type II secretory pathway component PulF
MKSGASSWTMPNFRYKAVDDTGQVFKGLRVAFDEEDLERELRQSNLSLIGARELAPGPLQRLWGGTAPARALVEFYHRFAQTLEIGLPVLSALKENSRYLPSRTMRKVAGEIKVAVEGGRTLHEAMGRHPRVFDTLDLAIIRMGEQTGVLPQCLKNLAAFREWKEDLRATLHKAAIYPTFVGLAICAVIGVWVGYVLPQMVTVLAEMDVALPGVTRAVLETSRFIRETWAWFAVSGVSLGVAGALWRRTPRGALQFHRYMLRLPLLGAILQNVALARLSHNFATMLSAGMTVFHIFETLADNALGNRFLEDRLRQAFKVIEGGESISSGFESAGGFPSLLLGAIRNGEETGTLDQAFQRLGHYFDSEVKRTVSALVSAIEPMCIVVLGGVFGLIVLSILLPLYDVIGGLGKAY